MRWGQITEVGLVRLNNEDSLLICPDIGLFAVADGMGGHQAGEVASREALSYLEKQLRLLLPQASDIVQTLESVLQQVNNSVYNLSCQDIKLQGMGTTITACLIQENKALLAHVGDSRAYLLRDNDIRQITEDHSLVAELVKSGSITEDLAQIHPQRNVLTQALGVSPTVEIDLNQITLKKGDRILLCTDGLTNHVKRREIYNLISKTKSPQQAVEKLTTVALNNGGTDNITIILIETE